MAALLDEVYSLSEYVNEYVEEYSKVVREVVWSAYKTNTPYGAIAIRAGISENELIRLLEVFPYHPILDVFSEGVREAQVPRVRGIDCFTTASDVATCNGSTSSAF